MDGSVHPCIAERVLEYHAMAMEGDAAYKKIFIFNNELFRRICDSEVHLN
jgi:hypothetical protein